MIPGRHVMYGDLLGDDVGTEMMQSDGQVFGARASLVVCSNLNARAIIFEYLAFDGGCGSIYLEASLANFIEQVHDIDYFS